jgi:NADH-quinone oxidoreductase subunit C
MPANYEIPLREKFGPEVIRAEQFRDNRRIIVPAERVYDVLRSLKEQFGFDFLSDLAGIDYLGYPNATDRYAVVYALVNTKTGDRLFVKTHVNDPDPELPSVVDLWRGADWMEREVYDMYGVRFNGHPDLRRILMPAEFVGHPLRKDYPLRGYGERHNFQQLTRAEG